MGASTHLGLAMTEARLTHAELVGPTKFGRVTHGALETQFALLTLRLHRSKVGWHLDAIGKEHDL